MAHPYTTAARVRRLLGPTRATTLLDRDDDGTEDAGVVATGSVALVDDAIERTCNRVDGALGGRYTMPCAAITDTPPTPGCVADVTDVGVAALLYEWLAPTAQDAKTFRAQFEAQLKAYRDRDEVVPGLAELAADHGTASVAFESIGTAAAGALDADGDRTGAWSQDSTTTDQARGI